MNEKGCFLALKGALEVLMFCVCLSVCPQYALKLFKGLLKGS